MPKKHQAQASKSHLPFKLSRPQENLLSARQDLWRKSDKKEQPTSSRKPRRKKEKGREGGPTATHRRQPYTGSPEWQSREHNEQLKISALVTRNMRSPCLPGQSIDGLAQAARPGCRACLQAAIRARLTRLHLAAQNRIAHTVICSILHIENQMRWFEYATLKERLECALTTGNLAAYGRGSAVAVQSGTLQPTTGGTGPYKETCVYLFVLELLVGVLWFKTNPGADHPLNR